MVGVNYLFVRWSQETTQRGKEERQERKTLTRRVYYLVQSELSCTRKPQNVYLLFINCWLKDNPGEAWLTLLHSRWGSVARESHPQQITGIWASVWHDLQCWDTVGLFCSFSIFYYELFSCVCDHVHTWMCTCHSTGVEIRGQPERVTSLLPPRGAWESYLGHQAWQQAICPLSELSSLAYMFSIIILTIHSKLCGWERLTFIGNGLGFPPLGLCGQHHGVSRLGSYWKPQKFICFWARSNCRQNGVPCGLGTKVLVTFWLFAISYEQATSPGPCLLHLLS